MLLSVNLKDSVLTTQSSTNYVDLKLKKKFFFENKNTSMKNVCVLYF